jgi:hypothetical protein
MDEKLLSRVLRYINGRLDRKLNLYRILEPKFVVYSDASYRNAPGRKLYGGTLYGCHGL